MFTPGTLAGVAVVVLVNTFVVAAAVRFFRLQLNTQLGTAALAVLLVPVLLFASTAVLSGVLGIGGDVDDRDTAVFVAFLVPAVLGVAIDLFWRRPPVPADLPEPGDERR